MATLNGHPVDRPAVNFCEIGGMKADPTDPDEFNIFNSPDWQPLLKLAEESTDIMRMRMPELKPRPENCSAEFFTTEEKAEGRSRFTTTTLRVAGRTLSQVTRQDADVNTVWTTEHLLKDVDDLKAYLQLPNEVFSFDPDIGPLLEAEEEVQDRGIVMIDMLDPLGAAASLFPMQDYTIIAMTEQKLFQELLEKLAGPILERTRKVSELFPGHLWRIGGSEYAAEPYLPPHLFREYMVRHTKPMVSVIQEHGGYARIHSHGRLKAILPMIIETGAVAIDPVEPPPQGDIELREIREQYGNDLVIFGNIEISDIENMEPSEFERVVMQSLKDGTSGPGKGFVLMPSACPFGREITTKTLTNYETMVRLATELVA